ncbi:MAG TPA: hybrid sensor histidine kinase/response regulator [Gammaproteobacteria bacterium]|nr:hybrid sensor histidine kinase/response regulator [Gammaproteobacteria bacterium]
MQPIATAKSPAERAFELLKDAALGVLLIDSDLRIRAVNATARQILEQIPETRGRQLREVAHLLEARGGVICYLGRNERWESAPPRVAELLPSTEAAPSSRMKDDFLATVSHELRSPLQGILGWLTLLQSGRLDAAQTVRALQSVERSVRLQAQLVNDIMDIARIEAGKVEIDKTPVDLAQLLHTTAEEFVPQARARRIDVHTDTRPHGLVIGDRERLHQLFANLLSNALKFTPTGGSVEIACDRDGDDVVTTITDTGHGIDAAFLPHLFKRFSQADTSITRRFGGLGLGLAIVRHLVELHGGTVTAKSEGRDRGATFTVRLPAAPHDARAGGTTEDERPELARLDGLQILLVEDDQDTLDAMTHGLTALGASVRPATSVEEAWRSFVHQAPHLVLTDLSMPHEDGYSLLRRIHAQRNRPPVVALTGLTRPEDKEHVERAGFAAFVAKPIDLPQLVTILHDLFPKGAP